MKRGALDMDVLSSKASETANIDLGIKTGISGIVFEIISSLVKIFLNIVFLIVNLGCSFVLNLMHLGAIWLIKKVRVNFAIDETFFTNSGTQFGNILNVFKNSMQIIGLSIIILIVIWQLFKIFFKSANLETDEPMKLGVRLIVYGILVGKSYDIIKYVITSIYTPIVNVLLTLIYDSDVVGLNKDMSLTKVISVILSNLGSVLKLDSTAIKELGNFAMLIQGVVLLYIDYNIALVIIKFAERAVTLFLLTLISPLTFACGVSKNTKHIFEGWIKSFCGVLIMYFMYNIALILVVLFLYLQQGGLLVIDGLYCGFDGHRSFIFSTGVLLGILSLMDQAENLAREMGFSTGGSSMTVNKSMEMISQGIGNTGRAISVGGKIYEKGKKLAKKGKSGVNKLIRKNKVRKVKKYLKEKEKVDMYKEGLERNLGNRVYADKLKKHEDRLNKLENKEQKKKGEIDKLKDQKKKYEQALKNEDLSSRTKKSLEDRLAQVDKQLEKKQKKLDDKENIKENISKGYRDGRDHEKEIEDIRKAIKDKKDRIAELKVDDKGNELLKERKGLLKEEQQERKKVLDPRLTKDERAEARKRAMEISSDIMKKDDEIKNHYKEVDNEIKSLRQGIINDSTNIIKAHGNIERYSEGKLRRLNSKINNYDKDIRKLDKEIEKAREKGTNIKELEDKKAALMSKKKLLENRRDEIEDIRDDTQITYKDEARKHKYKNKLKHGEGSGNAGKVKKAALGVLGYALELAGADPMVEGYIRNIADNKSALAFVKMAVDMTGIDEVVDGTANVIADEVSKKLGDDSNVLNMHKGRIRARDGMSLDLGREISNFGLSTMDRTYDDKLYNSYMDNKYRIEYSKTKIEELKQQAQNEEPGTSKHELIQKKIDKLERGIQKYNEKNKEYATKAMDQRGEYGDRHVQIGLDLEEVIGRAKEERGNIEATAPIKELAETKRGRQLLREQKKLKDTINRLDEIISDFQSSGQAKSNDTSKNKGISFKYQPDSENK